MMKLRLLFVVLLFLPSTVMSNNLPDNTWFEQDANDNTRIHLYFFWSKKCPHCLEALPYLDIITDVQSDLQIHKYQLVGETQNVKHYQLMMNAMGQEAKTVPAFVFCNTLLTGFDADITPQQIETTLDKCRQHLDKHGDLTAFKMPEPDQAQVSLPFIGPVFITSDSLPLITLIIAGVDAFNPCAFFVLMFLMSLMLHTRQRSRMLLVGGIFVFTSGLLYFLFMAAWLNLFRAIGEIHIITIVAALIAIVVGLINIKDFVWFKKGISLTLSDTAKPAIFQRARSLLQTRSLFAMSVATLGLAFFANLYEFLCTAGFPMVYTRILTLSELSNLEYYLYLVFYNLIYVIPLLVIVLLFAWTMGRRQLKETEGRKLKLISGTMMVTLGLVLLINPNLLHNILTTLLILSVAVLVALLMIWFESRVNNKKLK